MLRSPSLLQESTPPRLTGPSALQGLFLLLTRGAVNLRPDYTAPSCPTEQLSYSFFSRVDFGTLSEGGGAPPQKCTKVPESKGPPLSDFCTLLGGGGGGSVGPLLGQSPARYITSVPPATLIHYSQLYHFTASHTKPLHPDILFQYCQPH